MTRRKDSVILNLSKRIVTYHIRKNATLKRRKQRKLLIFNGIFDDSLRIKRPMTTTSRTSGITGIRSKQKTRIINKEKKRQRRDPLPFCCGGFHHSGPSGQLPFQGSLGSCKHRKPSRKKVQPDKLRLHLLFMAVVLRQLAANLIPPYQAARTKMPVG